MFTITTSELFGSDTIHRPTPLGEFVASVNLFGVMSIPLGNNSLTGRINHDVFNGPKMLSEDGGTNIGNSGLQIHVVKISNITIMSSVDV